VANHFRAKGHSLVIDAFLKSGLENAVLVIIGNPQKPLNVISDCYYQCRISEWAHQGKIKILANVSRQDTIMAFHAASLFVFGSEIECSPLVIFEAMASKTPWLSTAVGNVHELEGGIIVKSMEDMAAKMKQVLNESSLHELLAKSGYDAWRAKYTLERVTNLYEDLYSQVTRT
jgi:glycosyltransferase involved in cell wall biosynthesis